MLSFFGIDVNQWVIYAVSILFIGAAGFIGYGYWKHNIVNQAEDTFNNDQLKQALADKQKELDDTKKLNDVQTSQLDALQKQNAALKASVKSLKDYLASPQAAASDRASSDVLKTTIQKLIDLSKAKQ